MSIASIPLELREICRRADISSKSLLVEIARQPTAEMMAEFVERIARDRLTRDDARKLRAVPPPSGEAANTGDESAAKSGFTMKIKFEELGGTLQLKFAQPEVRRAEVIAALQDLISRVRSSEDFRD